MTANDLCDREQLRRLYDESLPEAVANDVADHVASCAVCQVVLESFAAEQSWWQEASQRLSKSSVECLALQKGASERPSERTHDAGAEKRFSVRSESNPLDDHDDSSDEAYASDFAVDFLEPTENPKAIGRLGEYEIIEVIGRGGMGVVLKGFQQETAPICCG